MRNFFKLNSPPATGTSQRPAAAQPPKHREGTPGKGALLTRRFDGLAGLQLSALSIDRPPSGLWPPSPLRGGLGFTPPISIGTRDTLSERRGLAPTIPLDLDFCGAFSHGSTITFTPFIPIGTRDVLIPKNEADTSAVRGHEFRGTLFPRESGGDLAESRKLEAGPRSARNSNFGSTFIWKMTYLDHPRVSWAKSSPPSGGMDFEAPAGAASCSRWGKPWDEGPLTPFVPPLPLARRPKAMGGRGGGVERE